MAIDMDDEILQDFLVEAGEILEELGEQLVELEQSPDDFDLLNAVFRGFHTIKGGAGFLAIDPLVTVCHRSEDVFNLLRQGQRKVDAALMDTVLQVVDVVNEMFASVQGGEDPEDAPPELIGILTTLAVPQEEGEEAASESEAEPEPEPEPEIAAGEEITEDEFDNLLDQLHGKGKHGSLTDAGSEKKGPASPPTDPDMITEDEFENLLDELHGKGQFGGKHGTESDTAADSVVVAGGDEITEGEFDELLDQLHGKGKHVGIPAKGVEAAPASVAPKAVKKEEAPKKTEPKKAKAAKSPPAAAKAKPKAKAAAGKGAPARKATSGDATVRVDTARLDEIMNMVGELVLVRNRLATLKARLGDEEVANAVANLDVVTADLQNSVMKTRMQPVKKVFGRFPRVVRDLARTMKKEIDLEMNGEDTDLDKNLIEALADPMVHLVRNAVDHGIESPDEREMAGKPRKGTVVLSATQEGDHILLSIADDGKGMDAEVLRRKAVEKGMMDTETAARLDKRECFNLIFHPGFSTKTEISDVSGRGVGMDVVKTKISQMNGSVEIDSELGSGSTIVIKLPLTLAILPTLMVILGSQPFALPLASVVEIFNLDLSRTNMVDGQLTIMVREKARPLFYLRDWLIAGGNSPSDQSLGHVVVVNVSGRQVCLVVDSLVGQEEVVIKPLGAMLQGMDGMAGATITGDGKIALIVDVPGLMRKYAR
ncbi:MAG: chemotaxis protein CheA [Gammaproteobacteria bacterium]|nr:chemotaxis protein CheA [Gammaproteobacteria bacterium]